MTAASRKRKRRKPPSRPSHVPHDCVVLAVDTATNSGWAIYDSGKLINSGECHIDSWDVVNVVHGALRVPMGTPADKKRAVLVMERPFGGLRNNTATLMALGAAKYVWRKAWVEAGGRKAAIVSVYPASWRSKVLGIVRDTKQREQHMGRLVSRKESVGADEAAAICIGRWAAHAGEVAAVLPTIAKKGRVSR